MLLDTEELSQLNQTVVCRNNQIELLNTVLSRVPILDFFFLHTNTNRF
jgi:hypothetical protein